MNEMHRPLATGCSVIWQAMADVAVRMGSDAGCLEARVFSHPGGVAGGLIGCPLSAALIAPVRIRRGCERRLAGLTHAPNHAVWICRTSIPPRPPCRRTAAALGTDLGLATDGRFDASGSFGRPSHPISCLRMRNVPLPPRGTGEFSDRPSVPVLSPFRAGVVGPFDPLGFVAGMLPFGPDGGLLLDLGEHLPHLPDHAIEPFRMGFAQFGRLGDVLAEVVELELIERIGCFSSLPKAASSCVMFP
jgi:hypothetical protein